MATLYDRAGNAVQVPDSQVLDALATGKLGLPKGAGGVPMVSKEGEVYELGIQDALDAAGSGWSYEGAEQKAARLRSEQYGDRGGEAALYGALRGLSFGLSDAALPAIGVADKETIAGVRDENPDESAMGEIGATVGSMLIPGGQAKALGALRGMGAAPRAVARAGMAVERGAARVLAPLAGKGVAGRIAARTGEVAAGAAAEGAVYGAGQFVSEVALGDIDATAENLISHVGTGAMWGGVAGGALGGGFQGVKELATGAAKMTKAAAGRIVGMWEQQSGRKALPGLADAYAGAAETVTGRPGAVRGLLDPKARARAVQDVSVRDDFARDMSTANDDILNTYDRVFDATTGKRKKSFFREISRDGNADAAGQLADDMLGRGEGLVRDDLGNAISGGGLLDELQEIVELAGPKARQYGYIGHWKDLQAGAKRARATIDKARGSADFAGVVHGTLDDLKREIGKLRYRKMRHAKMDRETIAKDKARELYHRLIDPLTDPVAFGKKAAETQKAINQRWVDFLDEAERRSDHRFTESFRSTDDRVVTNSRPAGFRQYIDDLGSVKNDLDEPWLFKQADTRQALMDDAIEKFDLPADLVRDIGKARGSLDRLKAINKEMTETVGLQNQLTQLEAATRGSGFTAGTGIVGGAMLGGPVGAAIGGAIGAVMDPARTIRQLATLGRIASANKVNVSASLKRYADGVRKIGKRAGAKARRMAAPVSTGALMRATEDKKDKPKNRRDAYRSHIDGVRGFLQNTSASVDKLQKSTETIGIVAPKTAEAMQRKAVEVARYLADKAPKNPAGPAFFGSWEPTETQLTKYERTLVAAMDPDSVLKDLESRSLTHEAVDALRTLYPRKYGQIVSELVRHADDLREKLPYEDRVQLSILFKAPLDPTMEPAFVSHMQASQIRPMPQEQGKGSAPTKATSKARVNTHMTNAQRLASKA